MKKKKRKHPHKIKKKRNKKYKGVKTQSKTTLAKIESNYKPAIDLLSGCTSNINILSNQLNFLTTPNYQPSLLTAVAELQDQLSSFKNLELILPKINHLSMVSPMLDLTRQAILAVSSLSISSKIKELSSIVAKDNKSWFDENIAKASLLSIESYNTINIPDMSNSLASILGAEKLSALTIQSSIAKATELSMFAEKSLYSVTIDNIGSRIGLDINSKDYLTSSFLGLSDSYTSFVKTFEINPLTYTELNPILTKLTSVEYFTGANLLEAISIEEDVTLQEELLKNEIQYENEFSLSKYLPKVNSGLFKMWKGAIEAYHSDNSDRVRHFSVSIRELFSHLFRILAPDNEINNWTKDKNYFDEKGNPTRKTRLMYICRNISGETFNTFVKKDVESTLAFFNIFQKGTHGIDPKFSPNNLITIKSKAETTLKFLLEIQFTTNK